VIDQAGVRERELTAPRRLQKSRLAVVKRRELRFRTRWEVRVRSQDTQFSRISPFQWEGGQSGGDERQCGRGGGQGTWVAE
jgi:hypothetical protein